MVAGDVIALTTSVRCGVFESAPSVRSGTANDLAEGSDDPDVRVSRRGCDGMDWVRHSSWLFVTTIPVQSRSFHVGRA